MVSILQNIPFSGIVVDPLSSWHLFEKNVSNRLQAIMQHGFVLVEYGVMASSWDIIGIKPWPYWGKWATILFSIISLPSNKVYQG